jgi:hypothetical protein
MNSYERAQRNADIVKARARGLGYDTISRSFGLSADRVRHICAEHRESDPPLAMASNTEALSDYIDLLDASIEEVSILAVNSNHEGARLGAIKARVDFAERKLAALQAYGAVPSFDAHRFILDLDIVAETIVEVLGRYRVPIEAHEEISRALKAGRAAPIPPLRSAA